MNQRDPQPARPWAAVIFDLDGVVTDTASVHARAWKRMFDAFLAEREGTSGEPSAPFDADEEYRRYVDGKPRYDGVADFLAARGISLPHGTPDDAPGERTVCGLGNRKNELFREELAREGATVYEPTVRLIRRLREAGTATAIVSSSKNCARVLQSAGLTDLFDVRVDGVVSAEQGLEGKPAPDIFVEAARRLDVAPHDAVVVEDALAGVAAGSAGGFGLVVGIVHDGNVEAMRKHGADRVVRSADELAALLAPANERLQGGDQGKRERDSD